MVKKENQKESKAWAVASMITGILSILLFIMPYFGLPLSILAIIGASKQKKIVENGMASAGNIMGIIGVVINSIMLIILLVVITAFDVF